MECIYDKLTSFFADTFPSELVLRLWDLIFMEISSATEDGKRRTLWLLLATAYYLFYVNQKEIISAQTKQQALNAIDNAAVLTYETDYVIEEILEISEKLFASSPSFIYKILPD